MFLYIIAAFLGIIIGILLEQYLYPSMFDTQIKAHLRAGKRVIICVDDEATMMQMTSKDKIRVVKAIVDFSLEEDTNGSDMDTSGDIELPHSSKISDEGQT